MIPVDIINRPFSSDFITGLMLPDGIFEATLGRQQLNAHFTNKGASVLPALKIYAESASHPGILITPTTHNVAALTGGASTLGTWEVDVSAAPAGKHHVSFIVENASGRTRLIKRIFVTRVNFNPADQTFSVESPEGVMTVSFKEFLVSKEDGGCGCKKGSKRNQTREGNNPILDAMRLLKSVDMSDMKDCPPQTMLIKKFSAGIVYTPPFAGQYGDLPYQDPWYKTLLAVLAVILFIIAAVVVFVAGTVVAGVFSFGVGAVATISCCSVPYFVALGLAAGAITSAILSSALDSRDPFRRGQDNTIPGAGELTVTESLDFDIDYLEPIVQGTPYAIGTKWTYTRNTRDGAAVERNYNYSVAETNNNIHVLSRYEIDAPDVVRVYQQKEKPFIVKARFFDQKEKELRGPELFVKCFLQRKSDNKLITFNLQDDGTGVDARANDGTYTGIHYFNDSDDGYWKIYVIAQDVNHASESMTPDEAAQIIGGQVLTHQLTINYSGGTCPLVPDGEVHVMS